ncbi:MAG: hypothetical protein K9W46_00925 [Candidatus Heimdallarchaeum endolithica]|uniref:Uncharacterized protein n=1 Tax=Candidatus Heimdallarchaeum endolithica TaxID=2876572 RepID=A0A9Y1BRS5_9ARCH|nr:MAG: hypothetical protein K9W46_00925 [Candidatus Heimdallarchaeum endolithica]
MEKSTESIPLWKKIGEKLTPYLTRDDFISMDKDRYISLIKRLKAINELSEKEYTYANINRDLILIRMGLIHNLPEITDDSLETILKQLAVHLAVLYYNDNDVSSWSEAKEEVLEVISSGFETRVTMGLSPTEHLETLRSKIKEIGKITKETITQVISEIEDTKDKLMQSGISGVTLHKFTQYAQKLKRANDELPTKYDILEEIASWQELISK